MGGPLAWGGGGRLLKWATTLRWGELLSAMDLVTLP